MNYSVNPSIEEPLRQITHNAGVEPAVVVEKMGDSAGDFPLKQKNQASSELGFLLSSTSHRSIIDHIFDVNLYSVSLAVCP